MPLNIKRPAGMTAFVVVWVGQIVSVLASMMTHFALTVWAYEETGSATALALVHVFFITPFLIVSPVAGVMVDRYNRKLMMMLSDLAAGVATIGILALNAAGALEVWHLFVAAAVNGTFNSFQWPAYSATISLMVPKAQHARANGMMSLIDMGGPGVIAPLLAGALLGFTGLNGILIIDIATFVLAVGALLIVAVPQPPRTAEGQAEAGSVWREAAYGLRYILARPSLLGLQLVFFFSNVFASLGHIVFAPMILARTGNNEVVFGSVQSAGAIGGLLGGVAFSTWGGFKRRVHGVLSGLILSSVFGAILFGLGQTTLVWVAASLIGALFIPMIAASNQSIWQAKVAPDVQGRVFAIRRLIAWFATPITPLIAGPLSDFVLEPRMRAGGALTGTFGWLVGTGPGAGMALLVVFAGLGSTLVGLAGYFFSVVRDAERLLPDHDAVPTVVGPEGAAEATA